MNPTPLLSRRSGLSHRSGRALALAPALGALLLLGSCDDDDDGGGGAAGSGFDLLLTDAPVDDLLAFTGTVQSAQLRREDGTLTGNLLGAPAVVDFKSLDGTFEWLFSGALPAATYAGAQIGFDPNGFSAVANDGSAVTVFAESNVLDADLPAPIDYAGTGYLQVAVDFDLLESLDGNVGSGSITVSPSGNATPSTTGAAALTVDEIKGRVLESSLGARTIQLAAFADGDFNSPLGDVQVRLEPSALLLDQDGSEFATVNDFYDTLIDQSTRIEVHGDLRSGDLYASRIEIEDEFGSGSNVVAELRGLVVGVDPGTSFQLLIAEIEKGADVVDPALAAAGSPASIQVAITEDTLFFDDDSGALASADDLRVGGETKVKFEQFSSQPFPAFKVEVGADEPEYEGFITDTSELPTAFTYRLPASAPAVQAGQVASADTDVRVELGGTVIRLDTEGEPIISPAALMPGLRMSVEGTLSGVPTMPAIAASELELRPGRLSEATRASLSPELPGFSTTGGEIKDAFGADIIPGPLDIVIDAAAIFEGDAETQAEFFALVGDVEIEVLGLPTGQPNEIRAYVIKSDVQ